MVQERPRGFGDRLRKVENVSGRDGKVVDDQPGCFAQFGPTVDVVDGAECNEYFPLEPMCLGEGQRPFDLRCR